jgi:hypothetical protein
LDEDLFLDAGMGHRGGENREQAVLFPVKLEELVDKEAMVRVIDAWVNSLSLPTLGFGKAQAARLGRPQAGHVVNMMGSRNMIQALRARARFLCQKTNSPATAGLFIRASPQTLDTACEGRFYVEVHINA